MRFASLVLSFLACTAALAQPPAAIVDAAFVDNYAKQHDYSGAVVIAHDGKVSVDGRYGEANRAFKVPNGPHTKYWIASITKAFTAVLVLQLHEEGKLKLDGTIADYLPDYTGEGARKITVRQLLDHTSGLPNFDNVKSAEDAIKNGLPAYQKPWTPAELVARFCSGALVNAPGTTFDYNNGDYLILGRIIEQVAGKPYETVLRERILAPLKLAGTGLIKQHEILHDLANTYFFRDDLGTLVNDLPVYPENWYAAGAMYATPADVLAFSDALFGGRLIKPATLALMTKPGLEDYGYGVWSFDMKMGGKSVHVVKRPGRIMGAQAMLFRVIEPNLTIVLLANTASVDLDEFAAAIARKLLAE